jgi:hypothetical protein
MGSYAYDAQFLKDHGIEYTELVSADGNSKVMVIPAWQGRVMTTSASGDEGDSYGWINYRFINEGKVSSQLENKYQKDQDQLLLNFILNFSRLDNGKTQVGNLHVHLDDINFYPGTDTMELIFSFADLHDAKLKQFNNAEIWKKLLDMAFPSTYVGTKYALRRNNIWRLSQFTDKAGIKFESQIINYKIVVIDHHKEEFVLNYKTKLDLDIKKFYAESVVIQDFLVVKDFTQLPYTDFERLLKSYEEFHVHSSIEKFDAIDTEVDKIFDKFGIFHSETISPYIEEEGEESA